MTGKEGVILIKVTPGSGIEGFLWPNKYKLPKKLTLAIGVPKTDEDLLRIAFSPLGSSITHTTLETIAVPPGLDYDRLKGVLYGRVLRILTMPKNQVSILTGMGHNYTNPETILNPFVINRLLSALSATSFYFIEDHRGDSEFIRDRLLGSGIQHLKRDFSQQSA